MTQELNVQKYFIRMTLSQRIQHVLLIVSFLLLTITGFALRYPLSNWAQFTVKIMGGYEMRAMIHRGAAVVMLATAFCHLISLLLSGWIHRRKILSGGWSTMPMMWGKKDWHDLQQTIRYYLRKESDPPRYGKYSYVEKVEYWSLLWGVAIMGISGIILSCPFKALAIFPKWIINVALIVHSYEAALAVLSIVIWHMYTIHFAPGSFPMNRTWITGKVSAEELKEHHPLEYERLMQEADIACNTEGCDDLIGRT